MHLDVTDGYNVILTHAGKMHQYTNVQLNNN